ncbi:MAG: CotH kinase family protein [Crocinitomicaceae bacterium]
MKKVNKGKIFRRSLLLLLIVLTAGIYFSNKFVKTKGFDSISDFTSNYWQNKSLAENVEPEVLELFTSEEDFNFLKEKREIALDRGIQINEGESYVPCKLLGVTEDTLSGEMRLKGHMTDHLEGDKWSFRIKLESGTYKEMYRFSLQNPATRSYANEWLYHELLKHEGIIALKYDFIRLKLNDKDLGIYAIEEHFGQHVPLGNDRPNGAILRWNPELYWDWRINEMGGNYYDNQNGEYQNTFVEPYDRGTVRKDSSLLATYLIGAEKLEGFRRGKYKTSDIFDVELMAKFHAIVDLIGGHHSLDWSDIKFFYNQETGKIEPVGYESFSVRETVAIAGQRQPVTEALVNLDYHNQLFSDSIFYAAYIKELRRICNVEYFESFQQKINVDLNKKLGILAHEFAYIKFSYEPYFDNIEKIKNILDLPKPLHAFVENKTADSVLISVAPVSDFPIVIHSVIFKDDEEVKLNEAVLIPPKPRNTFSQYYYFSVHHSAKKIKNLRLKVSIPGGENFEIEVSDFPSFNFELDRNVGSESSDSILNLLSQNTYVFNHQQITISETVVIEKGKELKLYPGQEITLLDGGQLIIKGSLKSLGTEENPVRFNLLGSDKLLINNADFIAVNTLFTDGKKGAITVFNSQVALNNCTFVNQTSELFQAQESDFEFLRCKSDMVETWINANKSELVFNDCYAFNGEEMIKANNSVIKMKESEVSHFKKVATLDHISTFLTWGCSFLENEVFAELNNASFGRFITTTIDSKNGVGFKIDEGSFSKKKSTYDLYKSTTNLKAEVL